MKAIFWSVIGAAVTYYAMNQPGPPAAMGIDPSGWFADLLPVLVGLGMAFLNASDLPQGVKDFVKQIIGKLPVDVDQEKGDKLYVVIQNALQLIEELKELDATPEAVSMQKSVVMEMVKKRLESE